MPNLQFCSKAILDPVYGKCHLQNSAFTHKHHHLSQYLYLLIKNKKQICLFILLCLTCCGVLFGMCEIILHDYLLEHSSSTIFLSSEFMNTSFLT